MKKKICKFDIQDLLPIGLTIVVLGIALAYGLNVMGDVKNDMVAADTNYGAAGCDATSNFNCTDAELNATKDAITGVAKIPEKLPLIVTVIVAAVIIGILVRYLMVRYN